jgi:rRNA-processing protein FCF1
MTTVYLDTSVAINESFLRSSYSIAFLKACAILQYTVVIPEIVVDELTGNFPKKLKEKSDAFQKAKKELGKLIDLDAPTVSLPDAIKSYEDWLEELIDEHGVVVATYPDIPAKELVAQSYEAKKPFKESGEGHKDYVVWKTILGHIASQQTTPPHIFLTNNTKDFCELDEDDNTALHPDLAGQIDDPTQKPRVYTSIKGAFDNVLSPNLEGITLDDVPDLGTQDIDSVVGEFLVADLPSRSLYGLEGVPFSNEITISSVGAHSIDSVTAKKADDEVIISIFGNVELEVDGFMEKFVYYHSEHENLNMWVVDGDWNDHVMLVSSTVDTAFDLTMFYSTQSNEILGCEISLPDEIEDEWPYK